MARHFLTLYLLIVATLAAASWGQERLWELYARNSQAEIGADSQAQAATLNVVASQLTAVAPAQRPRVLAGLAASARIDLELFALADIAGEDTVARLGRGEIAFMDAADGHRWMLRSLPGEEVLAYRFATAKRGWGGFELALSLLFYALIALVIMLWLWPLTRDLRRLERATATFGDRNWSFDLDIKPRSQIYPLAEAFRRMARRIDSLIGSHKDMSNAVAHEIKTPLARMRFGIEMARAAPSREKTLEHLGHINTDIAELDGFLKAALDYAILERAEVALNLAEHDFTQILPAVTESIQRGAPAGAVIRCDVDPNARRVHCDVHLMETVLRNVLYNALRYARREIHVTFGLRLDGTYELHVDDDGPGVPEADRERVFGTFVKLGGAGANPSGHGLGLAIVRRAAEWHRGEVEVTRSAAGGARFSVRWPSSSARQD